MKTNGMRAAWIAGMMAAGVVCGAEPAAAPAFAPPAASQVLRTLRKEHPRLLPAAPLAARMKELTARDPLAAALYARLLGDARKLLSAAPRRYEIPDGKRLLSVSRDVMNRVTLCAFFRLTENDPKFAERAWKELDAAAAFPDWNPSHFLDTAEMTRAFAVGYDWLYADWTPEQRQRLRKAIVGFGLMPAMKVYQRGSWSKDVNNWNQVCNGGIGLGALAIADEEPALCADILARALASLPLAMGHYAPDGAGTEGVTYWGYGTAYNTAFLYGMEAALGTDFGLSAVDGFRQSGDYPIYMTGAGRISMNFADCGLQTIGEPQHLWMARKFGIPRYGWYRRAELEREARKGGVADLLWWDGAAPGFDPATMPLDRHFRGAECASMRSSWTDPDALILGIQAGDSHNLGGHRHLDLGSFIFDAAGQRWFIDSGTDHETYMTHRNKEKRWAFYRVRAEGHNLFVVNPTNGPDQDPSATAKISEFTSKTDGARAVVDLTQAYAPAVSSAVRTFELAGRRSLVVSDRIRAPAPVELWWFLHTEAKVSIDADGRGATLSQKNRRLRLKLDGPAGARLEAGPAAPLPGSPNPAVQASNRGRTRLAVHLKGVTAADLRLEAAPEPAR